MSTAAPPFTHLLAAHRSRVFRAALGWLGDEQEAREAAQDALLKAWSARERYDPARPFYPWLHTIVRNTCRDAAARRRHRAISGLEAERVVSDARGPESQLAARQGEVRLQRALATLSASASAELLSTSMMSAV